MVCFVGRSLECDVNENVNVNETENVNENEEMQRIQYVLENVPSAYQSIGLLTIDLKQGEGKWEGTVERVWKVETWVEVCWVVEYIRTQFSFKYF